MSQANEVLEPERLELELGAQLAELGRKLIVEKVVARHDCDRDAVLLAFGRPESLEKTKAIDQRHPQIEDDGIWLVFSGFCQSSLCAESGADSEAFHSKHAGKRLRHRLIIVYDENGGRRSRGRHRRHCN